ncbi:MAG: hypothetical protein EAX89_01105 [Candidatus Lokiarchaeota archaeon]|nr:hypothetical protein [Candidatus Lokiarchaeota archaeon]
MVSYRLVIGITAGITMSFFTIFFFNMTDILVQLNLYLQTDVLKSIIILLGANFKFDIISFFAGTPSFFDFFAPQLLASIFIGFLSGTIAKGLKRGLIASLIVVVVDFLIWMLLSVISGEDLMALFQGGQLSATIGGVLSAVIGSLLGGIVGGAISGPYEEVY